MDEHSSESTVEPQPKPAATKQVYVAIVAVQKEAAEKGIGKSRDNLQQGYKFRGIDDVYNVIGPLLGKHNLCIIPRVVSRVAEEKTTTAGRSINWVAVECEYDFVSAVDGSIHTSKAFGEAMDSSDKATNKAMSAAYKYAVLMTFCVPVAVDEADSYSHEIINIDAEIQRINKCDTVEELRELFKRIEKTKRAALTPKFTERSNYLKSLAPSIDPNE